MESKGSGPDSFEKQMKNIETLLNEFGRDVEEVKGLHEQILSAPSMSERLELEKTLANLMAQIKVRSTIIRDELKALDNHLGLEDSRLNEKNELVESNSYIARRHSALVTSFINTITTYKNAKITFRDNCKLRLKEHIGSESDLFTVEADEIEKIIERGDFEIFLQNYTGATDHHKKILEDAEARHKHIKTIDESIIELHELMGHISSIVRNKNIDIENAAVDLELAAESALVSENKIGRAQLWGTEARRKRNYLILFGIFVGIIIGIVIYASLPTPPPELPKPMPVS